MCGRPDRFLRRLSPALLLFAAACWSAVLFPAAAEPAPPPGEPAPPTAFSRLADAGDAEQHPEFGHVLVLDEAVNRVDERGVTTTDAYLLYKVLTADGCKELSALTWRYDPQSSWVDVQEVNLIRDGARIPVPLDGLLDLPAPQAAIYWSDRIQMLQLPRLRVGDGVEARTFRKGFTYALLEQASSAPGEPDDERFIPPMRGEYFDIVVFQTDVPVLEKRYELRLPASKRLHSRVYNGPLYAEHDLRRRRQRLRLVGP